MIEIERHIEILLLSNDCVIVPELGGFMAHAVEARYDENDGMFLPPLRTMGFNPQLRLNDHLLVQSYIEAYDISYPEALRRIENEVSELKQHLETEGHYELNDIGVLSLNEEGNILFEPCEAGVLTPELYGLSTFEMLPLSSTTTQQPAGTETIDENSEKPEKPSDQNDTKGEDTERAITIRMSWIRNAVAAAAAIIAFFIMGSPVSNSGTDITVQQSSMLPIAVKNVPVATTAQSEKEAAAEVQDAPHATEDKVQPKAQPEVKNYVIVLASQTTTTNAENFISTLGKKGFENAVILPMAHTTKVRVAYGSFSTEAEAHTQLRDLRAKDHVFAEAWVLNTTK